jgi:hypothetical protein
VCPFTIASAGTVNCVEEETTMRMLALVIVVVAAAPLGAQGPPGPLAGQLMGREPGAMMLRAPGTWLGVALRDASPTETESWRLPPGAAVIAEVCDGSPAWRVNLRVRDVILEWDGEVVRSTRDLASLIRDTPPGRPVMVRVAREGVTWRMFLSPEPPPQTAVSPPRTSRVSTWS